ncbi:MAG: hypothetical protein Tsb002_08630 [Wenzhouxiangellaceae bacterium]
MTNINEDFQDEIQTFSPELQKFAVFLLTHLTSQIESIRAELKSDMRNMKADLEEKLELNSNRMNREIQDLQEQNSMGGNASLMSFAQAAMAHAEQRRTGASISGFHRGKARKTNILGKLNIGK